MLEEVNAALKKLRTGGTLKAMKEKWLYRDDNQISALPESA
jgi:ABC-type amino acid transport substrate-binding protein